ncbi:hypothetical protein Tco_1038303 [Tanacetum coccineum]
MSALKFADSHNIVVFLAKPTESDGFEQIVDFLNVNPIKYALTVNLTIYTSCIKQFWATAKVTTVNGEVQLQALVDGKKVIITETSVRSDLQLEYAEGIECLPNADIFEQLALMGYEKSSQKLTFYKAFFSSQWKFLIHTILQCLSAKSTAWNEFSSIMASRKGTKIPQSSGPTEPIADEAANKEDVPTQSNDPPLLRVNTLGSEEDIQKLKELMDLYTKLSDRVLDLETTKTAQAKEIASLKKRVKKLERKRKSKTPRMKRLFKIGRSAQVVSFEDEGLGNLEDESKQGRKIDDIDEDAKVTLVNETQGSYDDAQMLDIDVFNGEEVFVAKQSEKVIEEVVSTAEVSAAAIITTKEITLAQALAELRSVKPKVVVKDKAKGNMVKEEPMNKMSKKDLLKLDEELTFKLQAEEEEQARLVREKAKKVEEANISWDNVQAMIEADRLLAERLQAREQEELADEEKARLFVELLEKRKKHYAALIAQEKRNKPPTKAQKKSTMSTYLKHVAGYKQSQLKNKSFAKIQKLFDKAMTRVNMFVDKDTKLVKESSKKAEAQMAEESSSKRAGEELEQEPTKKQKVDDDKEREDLQQCFEFVTEEDVAINAIPLATKPASIINSQIHRKGRQGYYEIIRADGSAKTYLLFSQLLKEFDREDLENLWKLVKAKHGNTRPEEGYERVLWGNLKTMFAHHIDDLIWRNLQGKKVLLWRLYDSYGVHFVRFKDMYVYMLVEKRYPLTPATITDMLNKKLKFDY